MPENAANQDQANNELQPQGWNDAELAQSPHTNEQKAGKVQGMFSAIAGSYDLNNRLHSFWRDQAWRRFAVKYAQLKPTDRVLDCACGTGDLSLAFHKAGAAHVTGLDFTAPMLDIARTKSVPQTQAGTMDYIQGDAMDLPFDDDSFDVISIAFGIRNVSTPSKAIAQFKRVLKPSGRLIILEFSEPTFPPIKWGNDVYTKHIMPITATLISGDKSGAYKYLPKSVETFFTREEMESQMTSAGFQDVTHKPLTFGVCVCYRGLA